MTAKITLTITEGRFQGKEHTFEGRLLCTVGRSEECDVRLPSDLEFLDVSRRHCLLDINPPEIHVSDLGSLNGTYVNGVKIGQRARGQLGGEALPRVGAEMVLHDGDEIRVGGTVFRVGVVYPLVCTGCGADLPTEEKPAGAGDLLCDWCRLEVGTVQPQRESACAVGGPVE